MPHHELPPATPSDHAPLSPTPPASTPKALADRVTLFPDGGEMGELMRNYDWERHPLGDPRQWPLSLKTGIRILLHSRHPLFIWWTSEMYMFHNDAYVPLMGNKHPGGLGAKGYQMWAETWPQLGSVLEGILAGNEAFYGEELEVPMNRNGYMDETYWTFSYSAMPDDEGKVNGIFCACNEVTDTVLAKRRLKTIKDLSEATVLRAALHDAAQTAVKVLAGSPADIPFSLLYLLDATGKGAALAAHSGNLSPALMPSRINLPAGESPWPLAAVLNHAKPVVVALPLPQPGGELRPPGTVVLPIVKIGQQSLLGFLIVGLSQRLDYDTPYQSFHQMLSGQISTALSTVEARQQAEQERGRLNALFEEAPAPIVILDGPDFVFELVNPAYQQIFPGRQLRGKALLEALPEVAATPLPAILQEVYQTGQTFVAREVPLRLARREGAPLEEIYWTFTYQARHNTQGAVDGILVFAYEVTDQVLARRQVEASEQQFKLLTEAIPQIVWRATPQGLVNYFNRQWHTYTGLDYEQSKEEGWAKVFHPEDLPLLLQHWQQALRTGQPYQTEARIQGVTGEYRWFLIRALPLRDEHGRIGQWLGTDTDIHDRKQMEAALQESEARFRLMADAVPQIVWITDPEGRTEFFNKQWTRYTGAAYEPSTAAQIAASFVHPEDGARTMEAFEQARQSGGTFSVEHRIRSAAGTYRWFLVRAEPYRDAGTGQIQRWFGASIDIHDQKLAHKAMQESEQRFRIMADASPAMIWALNPDSSLKYANKLILGFLGISFEQFVADNWVPYIHPDDVERSIHTIAQAIEAHKPFRNEHRFLRHDGEYRWLLSQGAPSYYPNGDLYGYIGSSVDITQIKEAEQKLQHYARELAAANEELTSANEKVQASNAELSQANHHLSRVNADLDTFVYTASHDLKAPILNIEGFLQVLSRRMGTLPERDETVEKVLEMMAGAVSRFKETIGDLTDVARIQKQLDEPGEPVTLPELVRDTLLDLSQPIQESGAQIVQDLDYCPPIVFSRKNLKSVLYNLLSNAIKYRHPNREPLIRITCRPEGHYLLLSVEDNGLGMDTGDESKIFGMFKRLHAHVEGTGIGLYIVKKIVENSGGKIEVESQVGVGSAFKVYFKRRQ